MFECLKNWLFVPEIPPSGVYDDEEQWSGPDDLDPEDDTAQPESFDQPELQVFTLTQWGLRLPDESIVWGNWRGFPFDNPLDRMKMIAALQQTALEAGFAEGEQMLAFLSNYSWATREAVVSTVFSPEVTNYPLGDPAAADVHTSVRSEEAS